MPPMPKAVAETLAAMKLAVMFRRPYFVAPLTTMQFVYEPRLPAIMGVDKYWRCYVNDQAHDGWLLSGPLPQRCFVLLHELEHLLHDHEARREAIGAEHGKFNVAGDLSINSGLAAQDDLERPPFGLFPSELQPPLDDFLMTEVYYGLLPDPPPPPPGGGGATGGAGAGGSSAGPKGPAVAGDCGSGAGNVPGEWELGAPGTDQADVRSKDAPGVDEISARLVREVTAQAIQKAAKDAELQGTIPAGLVRWADQVLRPKVDWRRQLPSKIAGGLAEVFGRVNYTYARPSRRAAALPGIVLPAMRQPVPQIDLVINSSGSIDGEQLAQAVAEAHGLLLSTGGRKQVRVMSVDAQVGRVQQVTNARAIQVIGGGGTDMRVGFAAVEAQRPRSDMLVMVTDCYCVAPETRVLTADLRWVRADTVAIGDELLGPDERPVGVWRQQRLTVSRVEDRHNLWNARLRVVTDRGEITVSHNHPFWASRFSAGTGYDWVTAANLGPGSRIGFAAAPWLRENSWGGGWLAGMFDGEGSLIYDKSGRSLRLQVSQKPGKLLDRLEYALTERQIAFSRNVNGGGTVDLRIGGVGRMLTALGTLAPHRMLDAFRSQCELGHWPARGSGNGLGWATVRSVEPAETGPLVGLQTATGTLITEGFLSHNTPWPEARPRIGKIVIVAVGEHGSPPDWEHTFIRVRRPQDDEAAS